MCSFSSHVPFHISNIKTFYCSTCGKEFHRKDHLKVHERIHSGQKRFRCNYCDYSANQLSHVQQHTVHKHTRNFPHLCSCVIQDRSCSLMGFYSLGNATTGTGLRRKIYNCSYCSYTAKQLIHLKEHIIYIHTRNFPFICSVCGRGFTAMHRLKAHQFKCKELDGCSIKSASLSNQSKKKKKKQVPQPDHLPQRRHKKEKCLHCQKRFSRWRCRKCCVFLCMKKNGVSCYQSYHKKILGEQSMEAFTITLEQNHQMKVLKKLFKKVGI
ncbi:PR domain zinc finger protein 1 like protein [Argiope bruennichi]|uniref:PR domain zinc finger protein 1 like protein n=1 Tax=Argiope bruennichi TaxID=94029 RepID=A0A8T0EDC5_ARGBR|nr:PR domain zinc finger protein 1 like protein [Argiope bruennichi]